MSMINGLGSNNPANMESKLQHSKPVAFAKSFDASNSSLVSLSQPQQEGYFESFLSGVWSVITWPFRALSSLVSWLFGTGSTTGEEDGKKSGLSDAFDDLIACFSKENEDGFESAKFKEAYNALSSAEQKTFRTYVHIQQGFEHVEGKKDAPTKLLAKTEFADDEQDILKAAVDLAKSTGKVDSLGKKMSKQADTMLAEAAKEDGETDFEKETEKLTKEYKKLPEAVRDRIEAMAKVLGNSRNYLYSKKEEDRNKTERTTALELQAQASAMKMLAHNHYLALGNTAARDELVRMLREMVDKGDAMTAGDFRAEYNGLSAAAKRVLADAVGYAIGRPKSGEAYIAGTLKLDGPNSKARVPDTALLRRTLGELVKFDGERDVPDEYSA